MIGYTVKFVFFLLIAAIIQSCSNAPSFSVGSDTDEHHCIGSAGYSWCEQKNSCERPWELASAKGFKNTIEQFD